MEKKKLLMQGSWTTHSSISLSSKLPNKNPNGTESFYNDYVTNLTMCVELVCKMPMKQNSTKKIIKHQRLYRRPASITDVWKSIPGYSDISSFCC